MSEETEKLATSKSQVEPIWGIVANIIDERPAGVGGQEIRKGTRKFNAGQKVYFYNAYWGMGAIQSTYIGHYRGKHNYIICTIKTAYVTNFRAELIYSPTIIRRILDQYANNPYSLHLYSESIPMSRHPLDGSEESRQKVEKLAASLTAIAEYHRQQQLEKIARHNANSDSTEPS